MFFFNVFSFLKKILHITHVNPGAGGIRRLVSQFGPAWCRGGVGCKHVFLGFFLILAKSAFFVFCLGLFCLHFFFHLEEESTPCPWRGVPMQPPPLAAAASAAAPRRSVRFGCPAGDGDGGAARLLQHRGGPQGAGGPRCLSVPVMNTTDAAREFFFVCFSPLAHLLFISLFFVCSLLDAGPGFV